MLGFNQFVLKTMLEKRAFQVLVLVSLLSLSTLCCFVFLTSASPHLTEEELSVISLVNGTIAYGYDVELERIGLDHNLSGYSFRSAGSSGANNTAMWIKNQFENLGLDTHLESFEFTTWDMPTSSSMVIDEDGNESTTNDQVKLRSFQPAHLSWPTVPEDAFKDVVVLPLPENVTYDILRGGGSIPPYAAGVWANTNVTNKILVTGREVTWNPLIRRAFEVKIESQPPAAIVYTNWYEWMSSIPPWFGSATGAIYWNTRLPLAYVDYYDGLLIREAEQSKNASAEVEIPAQIGQGTYYNVVGKIEGKTDPNRSVIISGHYDTVMTAGFCDNGAGTAGVIELARVFTEALRAGTYAPDQTLIFIAFTGEELGFFGAVDYMRKHKPELSSISAVINLDCIGNDIMNCSETFPDDRGLDLDEIVVRSAKEIGMPIGIETPGGSDQEAFRNPLETSRYYVEEWGIDPNISDAARVKASTMLFSSPLFYSEWFTGGTPGWIHTGYDNSTSTANLGWVEPHNLEAQLKVAALTVLRVFASLYNPFISRVLIGTAVTSAVVLSLVAYKFSEVKSAILRIYVHLTYYMDLKEVSIALMLTVFLLFSSYAATARIQRIEIISEGLPAISTVRYFGYPFEMLGIPMGLSISNRELEFAISELQTSSGSSIPFLLWPGLLLNIGLFFLGSMGIVYIGARIKDVLWGKKIAKTMMAMEQNEAPMVGRD